MYNNTRALLFAAIAFITILPAFSQNNTNSPYTRFGYGELNEGNSGEQRAMGGVAIGARSKGRINAINPASYSAVDSMSFMFDFAASGLISSFSDDQGRNQSTFNSNLEYITMQFRLFKGVGFSAGLLPYSYSGYNFYTSDSISTTPYPNGDPEGAYYTSTYTGTGGFTQVYAGLSVSLFDHVALGANVYYMFGKYDNTRMIEYVPTTITPTSQINSIKANNFRFRIGAQFFNTFADKHDVTLGFIYEPKMSLNGDATQINATYVIDTIDISNAFELPQLFGGGVYYTYDEKLSVGIDYSFQQWSDVKYFDVTDSLRNSSKLSVGVEYQPNYRSRKFFQRTNYRLGFNMTDPYYKIGNQDPKKNFGITFGVGLPLSSGNKSTLNLAFEYGKINSYNALKEDYFKFTLNVAFNEAWFFKRKL